MGKGFEGWIEIFKTGTHTDSAGETKTFGDSDLERMVSLYDPEKYEAPIVIGHPKMNALAYGWVEGLKKEGALLLMKVKNVVPEFADMVKRGLFKKRSISLSPDGSLNHIGFLGAAAPAIKGLADIAFKEDDSVVIEYSPEERSDHDDERKNRRTEKTNKQEGHTMSWKDVMKSVFTKAIDDLPDEGGPDLKPTKQFSEAEVEAREKAAADEAAKNAKEEAKKEFAEKQKTERIEKRKDKIREFVEKLKADGKMLPAWEKMGLLEFMLNLDGEETIEFSKEKKVSSSQWMREFLEELPKVINFEEIAKRDKDAGKMDTLEEYVQALMKEDKDLTYSGAMHKAKEKKPELFETWLGGSA